jgi:hypothetical protein
MIQAGTPVVVTSGSMVAEPGVVVGFERPFVVVEVPRLRARCLVLADDIRFPEAPVAGLPVAVRPPACCIP